MTAMTPDQRGDHPVAEYDPGNGQRAERIDSAVPASRGCGVDLPGQSAETTDDLHRVTEPGSPSAM